MPAFDIYAVFKRILADEEVCLSQHARSMTQASPDLHPSRRHPRPHRARRELRWSVFPDPEILAAHFCQSGHHVRACQGSQ